jgi:hypothetical protein
MRLRKFLSEVQPAVLVLAASGLWKEDRPSRTAKALERHALTSAVRSFAAAPEDDRVSQSFNHAVGHEQIADYVEESWRPLDANTSYNLACYRARREQWTEATAQLTRAVELSFSLGKWALKDPVLSDYCADRERRDKLEKLVEGRREPAVRPRQ